MLLDAKSLAACGVRPEESLLVALSGGADSVALLHSLLACRRDGYLADIRAAHLIHGIRGGSAEADAAFCETLCRDWGVELMIGRVDAPAYAKDKGLTLEQAARELRYAFLREQAKAVSAGHIATAHHADDQAETVLLHMMRGSGRTGLSGMRRESCDIVRPLLGIRRAEIESYLAEYGIAYRTDETNALLDATRNRVRHELLPLMESFNPRIRQALCRLAGHMAADEAYFETLVESALLDARQADGYACNKLSALAEPIRTRLLRQLLSRALNGDFCEADIRRLDSLLMARTGSCIEFKTGLAAWLENETLLLGKRPVAQSFETAFVPYGVTLLPEGRIVSERATRFVKPVDGFCACVNAAAIPEGAVIRTRRDGDVLQPFGMTGTKLLSDYLIDRKCARTRRDMPLLCAGGEVLWVLGYTVSEKLRVKADTDNMMRISYEEDWEHGTDA